MFIRLKKLHVVSQTNCTSVKKSKVAILEKSWKSLMYIFSHIIEINLNNNSFSVIIRCRLLLNEFRTLRQVSYLRSFVQIFLLHKSEWRLWIACHTPVRCINMVLLHGKKNICVFLSYVLWFVYILSNM